MRFRFTIRMAMLATLVASVGFAYYSYHERLLQRRLLAMSQIEGDSGFVTFRDDDGGKPIAQSDDVRRYDQLERIYLAGSRLEQRTLDVLPFLNEAFFISFNSSDFADHHVQYLDEFTNLREIQLNGTQITETGLEHISKRHRLTRLALNDTSVDDDAIDALAAIKSLQQLCLRGTRFSDEGMKRLQFELPDCDIFR